MSSVCQHEADATRIIRTVYHLQVVIGSVHDGDMSIGDAMPEINESLALILREYGVALSAGWEWANIYNPEYRNELGKC